MSQMRGARRRGGERERERERERKGEKEKERQRERGREREKHREREREREPGSKFPHAQTWLSKLPLGPAGMNSLRAASPAGSTHCQAFESFDQLSMQWTWPAGSSASNVMTSPKKMS